MIETMGGRKVILLLLCIGIAVAAMVLKGDVPAGLSEFLKYIFGIFVIGNGIEHAAVAATTRAEVLADAQKEAVIATAPRAQQEVDPSLGSKLDTLIEVNKTNQQGIAFLVDRVMGKK